MPDSSADLIVNALALAHVEDLGPVSAPMDADDWDPPELR